MADILGRAQRGVFRVAHEGAHRLVFDAWGGGAFLLLARDEIARADGSADASLFVGRVVAGTDGCAVLPGIVWLPAEATALLAPIFAAARARGLAIDAVADALLRMDHTRQTMSRVKVAYAFREAALDGGPTVQGGS